MCHTRVFTLTLSDIVVILVVWYAPSRWSLDFFLLHVLSDLLNDVFHMLLLVGVLGKDDGGGFLLEV